MKLSDFDYFLPKKLIAQEGLPRRDESRLMVLSKEGQWEHHSTKELPNFFKEGDLLVLNNSRVIQAKLLGKKETGGKIDCLVLPGINSHRPIIKNNEKIREVLLRGSNVKPGMKIYFDNGREKEKKVLCAEVTEKIAGARFRVAFDNPEMIDSFALLPLPPYIKEALKDPERYQTIYSKEPGSLAAPTAGLHFTNELMQGLRNKGVECAFVTLHIGTSTFAPIQTEDFMTWKLAQEYYQISNESAGAINSALKSKRRIFAVGTTSVRTLESSMSEGTVKAGENWTDIFIYPGYQLQFPYSGLLTNFHLPKSSLILLVSAFMESDENQGGSGREKILSAYAEAVKEKYRFYSLGDAMLILK